MEFLKNAASAAALIRAKGAKGMAFTSGNLRGKRDSAVPGAGRTLA
mgnify:CR=1 FL=1